MDQRSGPDEHVSRRAENRRSVTILAMQQRTLEQQIGDAEAKLGGMLLAGARHDRKIRPWVLKGADNRVTRDIDRKHIQPLLKELAALGGKETTAAGNGKG